MMIVNAVYDDYATDKLMLNLVLKDLICRDSEHGCH